MKKKQIASNILFCTLISAIVIVTLVGFAASKDDKYPFNREIVMANHSSADIKSIDAIMPNENGEVFYDELKEIPDNAMLGSINYNGNEIQLVYNCNDASLIETATLLKNGDFVGEIGCAKIFAYKSNISEIMNVAVGETIDVNMPYGSYKYKCVQKIFAESEWDAANQEFHLSRGLVLYSDRTSDYGFSDDYDLAVFEMVSGPKIVG